MHVGLHIYVSSANWAISTTLQNRSVNDPALLVKLSSTFYQIQDIQAQSHKF